MFKLIVLTTLVLFTLAREKPYNEWISARMANLSTAIYKVNKEGQPENQCILCYQDFQLKSVVESLTLMAMIGYDKTLKSVVVVFRGSDNTANWVLSDFLALHSLYPKMFSCFGCHVHLGFRNSYAILVRKGLKKQVKAALDEHPGCGIIYTGHSLGGALANYAVVRFS